MSAPGIQLNSAPLITYFQPSIRQYLQNIKEAVMSNNLPAARQAFAQLTKAVPTSSQGSGAQANELAARVSQGLHALGSALNAGDLSRASQAVGELRQNIQSASDRQAEQPRTVVTESPSQNGSDVSARSSEPGSKLSVRI